MMVLVEVISQTKGQPTRFYTQDTIGLLDFVMPGTMIEVVTVVKGW